MLTRVVLKMQKRGRVTGGGLERWLIERWNRMLISWRHPQTRGCRPPLSMIQLSSTSLVAIVSLIANDY